MEMFYEIMMYIGMAVTAATAIVAALDKIAAVTPTTKDDKFVGKAKQYLGVAAAFLDNFSTWTHKK